MTDNSNLDRRIETALKNDASRFSASSSEVPSSLRSLISNTPAASTASVVPVTTAAKFMLTKITLWSAGGILAFAVGYFALTSGDKAPAVQQERPVPSTAPVLVDTPKQQLDTSLRAPRQAASARKLPYASPKIVTQAHIDSMLRAMPEPENTLKESPSIKGELRKRK